MKIPGNVPLVPSYFMLTILFQHHQNGTSKGSNKESLILHKENGEDQQRTDPKIRSRD